MFHVQYIVSRCKSKASTYIHVCNCMFHVTGVALLLYLFVLLFPFTLRSYTVFDKDQVLRLFTYESI